MAVLLSGTTIGGHVAVHANNISTYALTSIPSNVITTSGGQTIAGITYFSNGESLNLYGIRGRFANEYIHLYEKVGIGHPGGWGQGEANTPTQGLSIYGGINIAYARDNGATINTYTRINKNWGGGDYSAEAFTIRGTYPSITLRSTQHNSKWLIHHASALQFYYGGTVDDNNWANKFEIPTDGNIWMAWANANISTLLDAKQNASTAITTSNIGSQSVSYASSAGNADTVDGRHADYFYPNNTDNGYFTGDINGSTAHQRLWGTDSVQNLVQFNAPTSMEYSTDGVNWTSMSIPLDVFSGKIYGAWGGIVANVGNNRGAWRFVRMTWVNFGYRFFSHFTLAHSTNGHSFNFVFQKSDLNGNNFTEAFRQNNISSWPGYTFVKHSNVSGWWDTRDIRLVFELNHVGDANNAINIGHIGIMGSYGSFTRLYDWDYNRKVYFSNDIHAPRFVDSDNSTYYLDPSSESRVRKIWIDNGGANGVGWSTGLNMGDGSNYWNLIQDAGTARQRNFGAGGYDWYSNGGTQLMILSNAGNLSVAGTITTQGNSVITSGNIASQSVSYADESGFASSAGSVEWTSVQNKPATFPPSSHTHPISEVTGLQTALDGKQVAGSYVIANGTSAGNIDSDWGQSFKTFDPIPSGTPPLQSPNIRTINVGEDYNRRTQLAFDYASDVAYFRRRTEAGWASWREFIHSGNYSSYVVPKTGGSFTGGIGGTTFDFGGGGYVGGATTIASDLTVNQLYNNGWFRNNNANQGLYNQSTTMHWSSQTNGYWDASSTNAVSAIRFWTGGHLSAIRGYVYSDTSNDIGFLNRDGNWSLKTNLGRHTILYGNLTVGQDAGASSIYMYDSDEGTREIHCNSNRIGFLTQGGSWGSWCEDDGSWTTVGNISGGYLYSNYSVRVGEIWGQGGLYRSSGIMLFGTENEGWRFSMANSQKMYIGTDGNIWMAWAGDYISNLLAAKQNASTAINTSNIGSQSVNYATSAGSVAWSNVSSKPATWLNEPNLIQGSEPDTIRTSGFFESYLGSGNPTGTWMNYINVRHSNTNNGHGFQIGMSYYDNNLWFRSYSGNIPPSFQSWSRALGTNTDPYPSNMNQYVRTTDDVTHNSTTSPTFLVNNHSDNTKGYRIHNTSGSSVSAMFTNSSNQLVIAAGAVDQINLNKKVYVNGVALGVNVAPSATAGRIDASNDIVAYSTSDERFKENITPISNALDKVKTLTGVEFDWRKETKDYHGYVGHDVGVIAQQVKAVLPEAVRTNANGYLAVRYEKLIGLLIEANKELAARVEELEKKLS